jgi:hypothetical protein
MACPVSEYARLIEESGVTMTAEAVDKRPDALMSDLPFHFRCVFAGGSWSGKVETYFSMGIGHAKEPTHYRKQRLRPTDRRKNLRDGKWYVCPWGTHSSVGWTPLVIPPDPPTIEAVLESILSEISSVMWGCSAPRCFGNWSRRTTMRR